MAIIKPTREVERRWWALGKKLVAGIDEVGRGPAAGPVTVGAVILPDNCGLVDVADSKLLSATQRWRLAAAIRRVAVAVGLGWASAEEIDQIGIVPALTLASKRALADLRPGPDVIILDGNHNYLGDRYHVDTVVKADQSCLCAAAASVVAKVARDNYMELLAAKHPQYGLESNKGYLSAVHLEALRIHGPSPAHRHSWKGVGSSAATHPQRPVGQLSLL